MLKKTLILCIIFLVSYPMGYYVLESRHLTIRDSKNNHQGVGVYLINLDRALDRYNYVLPSITALGYPFEKISAVEGKLLPEEEINQKVDFNSYMNFLGHYPKLGTIGCSLSHINAWQKFLESDYEFGLIFEDDISFNPTELKSAIELLVANKKYWDINSFELSHKGMPLVVKHLVNNDLVVYLTEVTHSGAYLLNRKAAAAFGAKALPIKMPIDHFFTRSWEFGLKFTGIEPRLVQQSFGDSEINSTSANYDSPPRTGNGLVKIMFKIQSYLIRFGYNLRVYFGV